MLPNVIARFWMSVASTSRKSSATVLYLLSTSTIRSEQLQRTVSGSSYISNVPFLTKMHCTALRAPHSGSLNSVEGHLRQTAREAGNVYTCCVLGDLQK